MAKAASSSNAFRVVFDRSPGRGSMATSTPGRRRRPGKERARALACFRGAVVSRADGMMACAHAAVTRRFGGRSTAWGKADADTLAPFPARRRSLWRCGVPREARLPAGSAGPAAKTRALVKSRMPGRQSSRCVGSERSGGRSSRSCASSPSLAPRHRGQEGWALAPSFSVIPVTPSRRVVGHLLRRGTGLEDD